MITLTIAGQEYKAPFNLKFMRELDKTVVGDANGIKFGAGVQMNLSRFVIDGDVLALETILLAAIRANGGNLSQKDMDDYFDDESTDIDALSTQVMESLETGKFTKNKVAMFAAKKAVAQTDQKA